MMIDVAFLPGAWNDGRIEKMVSDLQELCHLTIVKELRHDFTPQGCTYLALLSESHLAIHTYPEHDYISVDLYTCGGRADARAAVGYFQRLSDVRKLWVEERERGK